MGIRKAVLKMIAQIPGSWDVAAPFLGMSVAALRNRAYEVKGQVLTTDHQLALQQMSGKTYFAEAVAAASDGTFTKLPPLHALDKRELNTKFHTLYAELGTFSQHFTAATEDNVIDSREREVLVADVERLHQVLSELLALALLVYGRGGDRAAAEGSAQ